MLPYELRPVALPSYPHPIASVQDCHIGSPAEESAALLPSSTATPNDEWLEAALVVDESTGEDVLEVALNLSFIERQLGTSSAEAVRATQRLTREAFTVTGGADVHRLLHRLGGSTGSRLMQAATDRRQVEKALNEALERQKQAGTAAAIRSLLLGVVLVAVVVAIAFKKTTSEKK